MARHAWEDGELGLFSGHEEEPSGLTTCMKKRRNGSAMWRGDGPLAGAEPD